MTGYKAYSIESKLEGLELIDLFRIPHFEFGFLSYVLWPLFSVLCYLSSVFQFFQLPTSHFRLPISVI